MAGSPSLMTTSVTVSHYCEFIYWLIASESSGSTAGASLTAICTSVTVLQISRERTAFPPPLLRRWIGQLRECHSSLMQLQLLPAGVRWNLHASPMIGKEGCTVTPHLPSQRREGLLRESLSGCMQLQQLSTRVLVWSGNFMSVSQTSKAILSGRV